VTGDAAVVREALVNDDELTGLLGQVVVVQREDPADRDHVAVPVRLHRPLGAEEAARARVRLVSELHRGTLLL
jgi:hypothetical protein